MKSIPVTPELINILENALSDTTNTIYQAEKEIEQRKEDSVREIVLVEIERLKQLRAITKDIIERYKD